MLIDIPAKYKLNDIVYIIKQTSNAMRVDEDGIKHRAWAFYAQKSIVSKVIVELTETINIAYELKSLNPDNLNYITVIQNNDDKVFLSEEDCIKYVMKNLSSGIVREAGTQNGMTMVFAEDLN